MPREDLPNRELECPQSPSAVSPRVANCDRSSHNYCKEILDDPGFQSTSSCLNLKIPLLNEWNSTVEVHRLKFQQFKINAFQVDRVFSSFINLNYSTFRGNLEMNFFLSFLLRGSICLSIKHLIHEKLMLNAAHSIKGL